MMKSTEMIVGSVQDEFKKVEMSTDQRLLVCPFIKLIDLSHSPLQNIRIRLIDMKKRETLCFGEGKFKKSHRTDDSCYEYWKALLEMIMVENRPANYYNRNWDTE